MKPRPTGSSKAPSAETRVHSITFRIAAAPPDRPARGRSLSLELDPGGPGNRAARDRPVCVPRGICTNGNVRSTEGGPCEVTADLLTRARAGDEEAFSQLVEPYRHPLQLHCYRILGSAHDAEDALQETLLSAWQGLGGFEERASVRTWLYRVATNCCLKVQRSRRRSQRMGRPAPLPDLPEPTRLGQVLWL